MQRSEGNMLWQQHPNNMTFMKAVVRLKFHCGTVRLVLINGSHSPGLVSPCWLTTHQLAHPKTAFDSGMFGNVAVYVLLRIWDSPHL